MSQPSAQGCTSPHDALTAIIAAIGAICCQSASCDNMPVISRVRLCSQRRIRRTSSDRPSTVLNKIKNRFSQIMNHVVPLHVSYLDAAWPTCNQQPESMHHGCLLRQSHVASHVRFIFACAQNIRNLIPHVNQSQMLIHLQFKEPNSYSIPWLYVCMLTGCFHSLCTTVT